MRNKKLGLTLLFIFAASFLLADQKTKVKVEDLAERYRDWLKQVAYIIQPIEKDVFMSLTSDRDRDLFIETFWKQRDPTPGTPENEYKEEHIKRFMYANKFYGRGTTREGWRTDMGRIHIILGPPVSIERFEATSGIVPCQAWSYYGDPRKELPTHFVLLFFQRNSIGEYRLYDPVSDGPAALLQNKRDIDAADYEALYEKIQEMAPTLADLSISLVPGEYYYGGYQPSPENAIIMAKIFESPKKDVNPSYATHFLDYKGYVTTEYLTNYVESEANVSLIEDPLTGLPFVHFSMAPKSMSYGVYEPKNQNYFNFRLDVSLRQGDAIIFQYNKEFPIYFSDEDKGRIQSNGISIEDSFPAIEGRYGLTILLQNTVGKEFSLYEKDIVIPGSEGAPWINGPFLGYKFEDFGTQVHIPYKVLDKKLVIDPRNTFSSGDQLAFSFNVINCSMDVWKTGQVRVLIKGMRQANPAQKSFTFELAKSAYNRIINFVQSLPLNEVSPDYYKMTLTLVDGEGRTLDEAAANFVVSPQNAIPHPIANAKGIPLSGRHIYHLMLARQYEKVKANQKAEAEYQKVFELAPESKEGILDYANFLLKINKFSQALEVNEKISGEEKFKFEYLLIRGRAQMGLGNYGGAISSFLEGNTIYNSDTRLINSLGYCYFKTGEKKKALEMLAVSLRLNPNQEDIKRLITEIEKS
jgi:GWxTD domain-containing protein